MTEVRAGIVGCGQIARHHADRLRDLDEDVFAVADIDEEARRRFADEYDATEIYEDYRRLVSDADIDLLVVAVPNSLHADCAVAGLEAGLDVFVEKPLAHTLEDARRIEAAERESDGTVVVGFVKSYSPWFEDLRRRVERGDFGTIYDIDVEYVRRRGVPQIGGWFTRKEISGGGVMIDVGVHVLHLALATLGFPAVETVTASAGSHFATKDDYTYLSMWGGDPLEGATTDTEDYARALVRTVDGATIHVHAAWASNGEPGNSISVYGNEAGFEKVEGGGETTVYGTDGDGLTETSLQLPDRAAFDAQWEYVIEVVRREREHVRNTVAEGVAVQEVVDAIYRSAESGRQVVLAGE